MGGIGAAREALTYADERQLTPAELAVIRRSLQEAWDKEYSIARDRHAEKLIEQILGERK